MGWLLSNINLVMTSCVDFHMLIYQLIKKERKPCKTRCIYISLSQSQGTKIVTGYVDFHMLIHPFRSECIYLCITLHIEEVFS